MFSGTNGCASVKEAGGYGRGILLAAASLTPKENEDTAKVRLEDVLSGVIICADAA